MSLQCETCGYTYEWEMFFNNHMRAVHGVEVVKSRRGVLPADIKRFLKYYYYHICENPTLDEIKELSEDLKVKKEKIYWWFFNHRRKNKPGKLETKAKAGKVKSPLAAI